LKVADQPFRFVTASYLVRICNHKATRLSELLTGLDNCSDASIFYHTFQSLSRHHFLTHGFANDFAQWVLSACNRPSLAERLAALDLRDYLSLAELRGDLIRVVSEYCQDYPQLADHLAFEPFFFCETIEVSVPLGVEAWTLLEFRQILEQLTSAAFHYHFITSRLRLQLRTNDFSLWFADLGLESLARRTNGIDVYTHTLEDARARLAVLLDQELTR
jgi:uncharacterized protein DUF5752